MENKKAVEELQKLMEHCCGCPFVGYGDTDNEGFFYCSMLGEECKDGDKDCTKSNILAIVKYNEEGEIIDFQQTKKYPENCVKESGVLADRIEIYPDVVHHYIPVENGYIRESFLKNDRIYYFGIGEDGNWVIPLYQKPM